MTHAGIMAFHPSANGTVGRANYVTVNILRSIVEGNTTIWDKMVPPAVLAYKSAYHRTLKDTPLLSSCMLFLHEPQMPYKMLERPAHPFYNTDSYREEMAVIAHRVYDRCREHIELGREEMERHHRPSRIKEIAVGDSPLRYIPKRKENKKLQPVFDDPYRVLEKVSNVVIRLHNIRTDKVTTVHTDRVRILQEDCVTIKQCSKVRRAFPINPQPEEAIYYELGYVR